LKNATQQPQLVYGAKKIKKTYIGVVEQINYINKKKDTKINKYINKLPLSLN
jgi:hypothetical protein